MKTISLLVTAFVAVVVGLMLINSVASTTFNVTGRSTLVTDESTNISKCYNGDSGYCNQTIVFSLNNKGVQCSNGEGRLVNAITITNSSGTTLTSGNYTFTPSNSSLVFRNTSTTDPVSYGVLGFTGGFFGGNISLIDYQYYPSDYLCEGWNRTILNMVPGFFGLAIFAIGVGLFYLVAKQEGIFGQV